jgi:hypothetical protein
MMNETALVVAGTSPGGDSAGNSFNEKRKRGNYELQSESDRGGPDHLVPAIFGGGFWGKLQRNDQWTRWRYVNRERLTVEVHCGSGG